MKHLDASAAGHQRASQTRPIAEPILLVHQVVTELGLELAR